MGKRRLKPAKGLRTFEEMEMFMNRDTYNLYFNMFMNYAINMFKWKNLPETIDERYLELTLFNQGYICFFKDDITGMKKARVQGDGTYLALECTLGGRFNVYNLPTQFQIVSPCGYTARRSLKDSVIIYNNYLHQPTRPYIAMYAYRLYNIERTIDINLNQLKHPYILTAPENQLFSFKQLWKKIQDNEPMIMGDSRFDVTQLQAINTGVANNTIELNDLKHQYMNECLTFLGIKNANTDKKERLISSEVEANNEQINISRDVMLNARKMACEQINEMFGLNVDVEFRDVEEQKALAEALTLEEMKEGESGE